MVVNYLFWKLMKQSIQTMKHALCGNAGVILRVTEKNACNVKE